MFLEFQPLGDPAHLPGGGVIGDNQVDGPAGCLTTPTGNAPSSSSPSSTREPPMSFYAVYDGHAGKDAAAFAASHVHSRSVCSLLQFSHLHLPRGNPPILQINGNKCDLNKHII